MIVLVLSALSALPGFQAAPQETCEFKIRFQVTDGSTFSGRAELPAHLLVKTKFGDMTLETSSISSIIRFHQDNRWAFTMTEGNNITGESSLAPIVLQLAGGKITVKPEDLQMLTLQRNPASLAPPPRTPGAAPAAPAQEPAAPSRKEAAFAGVEYRPAAEDHASRLPHAPAILLSTRKHAAVLDPAREGLPYPRQGGGPPHPPRRTGRST